MKLPVMPAAPAAAEAMPGMPGMPAMAMPGMPAMAMPGMPAMAMPGMPGASAVPAMPMPASPPVTPTDATVMATRAMRGEVDLDLLFPDQAMARGMQAMESAGRRYYFMANDPRLGGYYFMAPRAAVPEPDLPMPDPGPEAGLGG